MSSLESIQFLQEKLHELEPFFVFLNFFDTPYFYFLLIVFWMVFIDKKKGKTLFFFACFIRLSQCGAEAILCASSAF